MQPAKILIVEDEAITAMNIRNTLENIGFEVVSTASRGKEAIQKAEELNPDIILMDIVLKDEMDGIEAADIIQTLFNIPVIYLTAYSDDATYERAKLTRPYGFLTKPMNQELVKVTIDTAIYKHNLDKELEESEERYRLILENASSGVFFTDSDNKIKYLNQNFAEILGYTFHEMLNTDINQFIDMHSQKFLKDWRKGNSRVNEFKLIRNDGSTFWTLISASPVIKGENEYMGTIGVITDINARKAVEKALVQQGQKSEIILFKMIEMINGLVKKAETDELSENKFDYT